MMIHDSGLLFLGHPVGHFGGDTFPFIRVRISVFRFKNT